MFQKNIGKVIFVDSKHEAKVAKSKINESDAGTRALQLTKDEQMALGTDYQGDVLMEKSTFEIGGGVVDWQQDETQNLYDPSDLQDNLYEEFHKEQEAKKDLPGIGSVHGLKSLLDNKRNSVTKLLPTSQMKKWEDVIPKTCFIKHPDPHGNKLKEIQGSFGQKYEELQSCPQSCTDYYMQYEMSRENRNQLLQCETECINICNKEIDPESAQNLVGIAQKINFESHIPSENQKKFMKFEYNDDQSSQKTKNK